MPETPQQWFDRVTAALAREGHRESDWSTWSSWPFEAAGAVKDLNPPAAEEPPRHGAGGRSCDPCDRSQHEGSAAIDDLVWHDDLFMLGVPSEPSALPFALFLMPRRHADLADLTEQEAARQGVLLAAIERAACSVLHVPRIQVARWGDGSEHLHWWLFARPTGMLQLRGTFLSHWDDLLPPVPIQTFRADQLLVVGELARRVGGRAAGS